MHRARLQRSAGFAPLFLHAARHHFVVDPTRFEILLQQPTELWTEATPSLRARAARLIRHAHGRAFESNLSPHHQISRTYAPRSVSAQIPERARTLNWFTRLIVIPTDVEVFLTVCFRFLAALANSKRCLDSAGHDKRAKAKSTFRFRQCVAATGAERPVRARVGVSLEARRDRHRRS